MYKRQGQDITVSTSFVNTDLMISGVAYRLVLEDGTDAILALSKESLANCPKTLAMLAEYGFTKLKDDKFQDGTPAKVGEKDGDRSITVQLYDAPIAETQSTLSIVFFKTSKEKEIDTDHPCLLYTSSSRYAISGWRLRSRSAPSDSLRSSTRCSPVATPSTHLTRSTP